MSSLQPPWVFCVLFAASWKRYLNTVSAAGLLQMPLSLLFLELNNYYVDTVKLHVYAAEVLVRRGVDGTASDNRLDLCSQGAPRTG
jgi:hypothetical protein